MSAASDRVAIIGGGLAGSLLAILLARRGMTPVVVERSAAYSSSAPPRGRSINLALAARGIAALERAGILGDVEDLLIPMRGRMLHETAGDPRFVPYGQRRNEEIYSVSRAELNVTLHDIASERYGVEYRFDHECVDVDTESGHAVIASARGRETLAAAVTIAADGAGSIVRHALCDAGALNAAEAPLDHGYKEFTLPASGDGDFALDPNALHIWPRGDFMLIALPNRDRSFTATLFLPLEGAVSFENIGASAAAEFFAASFPDALALMEDVEADWLLHPTGRLGTVHCKPWRFRDRIVLIGDAAHAIVPFHGQGMNAAFEDCVELDSLVATRGADWHRVLGEFEARRRDNTRAIAEMALENYREMRDRVRDDDFRLRTEVAFELERRFPEQFVPRYSMVMFHPEISYAEAQQRGAAQDRLLGELIGDARSLEEIDFDRVPGMLDRAARSSTDG